ncbi:hypothetical protein [Pseudodesulfovibrio sediminis]|uniref:Uncharacterized protein n=1 Tax=Pseudodesulfovibrio sediminis TaxID=2810563 RepID=A0ABN6ESA7_9BACT|nr:hypothetical protein [Pseudodesulfovibrio sediminis]BCS87778.1 hypothetical protein PSDVSF_10200 [Pseudodesulfovibrio sediminis]
MSTVTINCPYCSGEQTVSTHSNFAPFYVNCPECARRFIAEPTQLGITIFRDGEAPCCSDPDCRDIEMGDSGQD